VKRFFAVGGVLVAALVGSLVLRAVVTEHHDPLIIVQWANSHPMREGLLPEMAERFNSQGHQTASGRPIEVVVLQCDSAVQANDLVGRLKNVGAGDDGCTADGEPAPAPTIVTPQSADWLVDINHNAGREVVDIDATDNIAETWLGIVTYRDMAECLGWPDKDLGYADLIELLSNPDGWQAYSPCSQAEWGRSPKLAFTNPSLSTSGRNVLVSLYSIAAGKPPADLTVADIDRVDVVDYVKQFQGLVDHYMPTTISLNTKVSQGSGYGHFFLMPEDNLANMYLGNESVLTPDGSREPITPVRDLVMIYPKEGAVLNGNPAGIVSAPWVGEESPAAAREWVKFLREDDQQALFAAAGFRSPQGVDRPVDAAEFATWGLNAEPPTAKIEPGDLQPPVLDRIIDSWSAVKKPAIVTFVVDVSGSMIGEPLSQVQGGLLNVVDAIAASDNPQNPNQVGLLTFSSSVVTEMEPAAIQDAKYDIADAISAMTADGGTALFDAVARAVTLTDEATGDPAATRAVVVLSDGEATEGRCLSDVVSMSSVHERSVSNFCGQEGDTPAEDGGGAVAIGDVVGDSLLVPHDHDVQVFFLGFGEADFDIGRILAEATGAEFRGSTQEDLAGVIEELSGYF
jgi:Ca-activated chloride channel family protein